MALLPRYSSIVRVWRSGRIHSRRILKQPGLHIGLGIGVVLLGALSAVAQVTASILGTVVDPTGSAVPDAAITVKSVETGAVRHATTDGSGSYSVLALPLGATEIRVEKTGFKPINRTG